MDNTTSFKIAGSISEIPFNKEGLAEVIAGEKNICVANHNGRLFAFAAKCPHAGAPLTDGYIDAAGNIVCAKHCYKFSMTTGRNTSGEGFLLKTYEVKITEETVELYL